MTPFHLPGHRVSAVFTPLPEQIPSLRPTVIHDKLTVIFAAELNNFTIPWLSYPHTGSADDRNTFNDTLIERGHIGLCEIVWLFFKHCKSTLLREVCSLFREARIRAMVSPCSQTFHGFHNGLNHQGVSHYTTPPIGLIKNQFCEDDLLGLCL